MSDDTGTKKDTLPPARVKGSDRDRKFLQAYFTNGMRVGEAELTLNPTLARDIASQRGSRRLRKIRETTEWQELLEKGGLDDLSLISKAHELLNAEQLMVDSLGEEHTAPDNRTRLGALQTVGKWRGKEKNIVQLETGPLEIRVTHDTEGI
jgi:hypothetical protein